MPTAQAPTRSHLMAASSTGCAGARSDAREQGVAMMYVRRFAAIVMLCAVPVMSVRSQALGPVPTHVVVGYRTGLGLNLCDLPQLRPPEEDLTCLARSRESMPSALVIAPSERPSKVPYAVTGGIIGVLVGTLAYVHATSHCSDWCLPGQFVVVPAGIGALVGVSLGLSIY